MAALTFKVGGDTSALGGAMRKAKGMLGGLAGMAKKLALGGLAIGAAGAAAAVGGLAFALKKAIGAASEVERLDVAFTAIMGSAGAAEGMVAHLRKESERTGASIGSMAGMVKKLMANGMNAEEAKKMNSSLLDVAGTLGMSAQEAGLLGTALAQVKAKGVASMEELRQQIAEKGVPIFEVLAQKMNVSTGELIKMVSQGKVSADVVMDAFSNLEGPLAKFRGGAEKMATTTTGSFQKLKANIAGVLIDSGQPFLAHVTSAFNILSELVKKGAPFVKSMAAAAGRFVAIMTEAFKEGKLTGMLKVGLLIAGKEFVNLLVKGFRGVVAFFGSALMALPSVIKSAFSKIMDPTFWSGVGDMFRAAGNEIAALISVATGNDDAAGFFQDAANSEANVGIDKMNAAGDGSNMAELMTRQIRAGAAAFAEQMGKEGPLGTAAERAALRKSFEGLAAAVDARRAADDAAAEAEKEKPLGPGEEPLAGGARGVVRPIVSSLAKVGGAALVGGVKAGLDKERNRMLKMIERNTKVRPVAAFG